ncbi:MAG TPA: VWA-like domain-containing protein [Flavilitoribacter sp.]|nr:VWA-like domain-containing protein [Flavilitoribacter sp.]HMQ87079.1 VWA-like domain-containing protein [Flavilitoribacter sp.]
MPDVKTHFPGFLNRFSIRNPFYAHFLSGLPVSTSGQIPDIALGESPEYPLSIWLNPAFGDRLASGSSEAFRLLEHEAIHLLLGHFDRKPEYSNTRIYHLAADLVVNQYISGVPVDAIGINDFPTLHLEPHREIGYYYRRLESAWEAFLRRVAILGDRETLDHPFTHYFLSTYPAMDRHRFWPGPVALQAFIERRQMAAIGKLQDWLRNKTADALAGLPLPVRDSLEALQRGFNPDIRWKILFRQFAATSRKSTLRYTLRRPSKRYGTTPGLKLRRRHRLFVGVDVSGSVDDRLLAAFFREIHRLWKTGADIHILEFDRVIQQQYRYNGKAPETVTGRGNTDFTPVIKAAGGPNPPDALILFTDGLGAAPVVQPATPLLWIIARPRNSPVRVPSFPGRTITMEIP